MSNESLVEFVNDQISKAEAAGTLPAEIIAKLRAALSDPDRVAEMEKRARHAIAGFECELIMGPKPNDMQRRPPRGISHIPDEWAAHAKLVHLTPAATIRSDCIVLLDTQEPPETFERTYCGIWNIPQEE